MPIIDTRDFWAIVKEYQNRLTSLEFQFLTPNLWGSSTETEKALKEFQDENGAQAVDVGLSNKDGNLNPDTERVRESIEYVGKGGGSIKAKAGVKVIYNSTEERTQSGSIDDDDDTPAQSASTDKLADMVKRLFGL